MSRPTLDNATAPEARADTAVGPLAGPVDDGDVFGYSLRETPVERQIKHLEFVQGAVNRLAANSFRIKGWSVVLASSLFVLAAQEGRIAFSFIALFPLALFWSIDGYFLWQERPGLCG